MSKKTTKAPSTPESQLTSTSLAFVRTGLDAVRQAEAKITQLVRDGEGGSQAMTDAIEVHLNLRSAVLGALVAYSQLTGLPDPRNTEILQNGIEVPA
jgi:hypothetical protein